MKRGLDEYRRIADKLLEDKPIRELGTGKVLCYRKADEREADASAAMIELLAVIDQAKEDLEHYAVCGTCSTYSKCRERYRGKREIVSSEYNSACYKWKWRGSRIDAD